MSGFIPVGNGNGGGSVTVNAMLEINKTLQGAAPAAIPAVVYVLISYTVPIGKTLKVSSIQGTSDGNAEWDFKINGTLIDKMRNYHTEPNIIMNFPNYIILTPGQLLEITAFNRTTFNTINSIDAFVFAREE
jgi:hypothetical protein